ncbi:MULTISPECIES: flagellar filament capping protein FliD [Enterobacter]|jgi:flagellar hook-associated protein 2|uniref:Flagellar hook-associated protein 2 n=1 Tax=Enterobacter roggenkampii TaxID=1812935 RepID=A0A8B3USG1_9ENTR|nr:MULTISPECIES: flagellar filament capping protein FliD [Enterobacter]OIR50249.1 flagellar filament capping protein FliD [Lelliottia nimipressuralis]RWS67227.1 flagellar filament capping protein FliD [Enterobacter cloacae]EKS7398334.1 flagellar filament capping protein FliD [Enterobacter roggenkampii]EKU9173665.1 flagellar filament capping protein FliD [Enterobacter roggenkampii MGH 34]EKU9556662.1 flagellar filament capping protein FliD [Enterobacter roggenkampii MGH 34]
MATISNLGVGVPGLSDLYDKLQAAEETKLTAIAKQKTTYDAQITGYGKLQSALTTLQTAAAKLAKTDTWNSTSVSSTNTAFSAISTSSANVGDVTINVSKIAKGQVLTTAPGTIDSNTKQLGGTTGSNSRTITITQAGADSKPLTVTLADGDTSLNGIAKAINAANGNVSASVVKADNGDYRLMLTSKTTGTDSDMTVTVAGDDTLNAVIGSAALNVQVKSQNAVINVNGIQIVRQSNTITDALPGVTLTLKAPSTADETLTIARSTDDNKKAITEWVNAYNSLQSTIAALTKYEPPAVGATAQSSNNGVLMGDSTIRGVQSDLRALLTNVQSGSYAIMAQLGITQDPVKGADGAIGNLKIDDKKLTKILTDDPAGVQAYFVGDGKKTGFATQMNNTLTDMLSTSIGKEGVIQNAKDGINATLKSIGKRYDAMELTIEATMARYKKQFNDLDKLVTKFNGTATYLTQQFSSK